MLLAEEKDCTLENLSLKDIQKIIPEADNKIINVLKIENSVSSRKSYGGTAPKNVLKAAREARQRFLKD